MLSSSLICRYFDNTDIKKLLIFAAVTPVLQNLIGMAQVLMVSVGQAKMLAVRNLIISAARLITVIFVIYTVSSVAVILAVTVALDIVQLLLFGVILKKNNCTIRLKSTDFRLCATILKYSIPMAVFTTVNALNRDIDKYLISLLTDTETLAIYTNGSKALPFDIIMASFCTVLIPEITTLISENKKSEATGLYKNFLKISYITTGILCGAAIAAAPQLMTFLYSEKYIGGLSVFCIYILVDLIRFTNITLILSAAGKTKWLMVSGVLALGFNALLNIGLYYIFGIPGPAIATLMTTGVLGFFMLRKGAEILNSEISQFFDRKHLLIFLIESMVIVFAMMCFREWLSERNLHYFVVLVIIAFVCVLSMLLLQGKQLLCAFRNVNSFKRSKKTEET
jgi:O-antigen/teichoic acid export membrane protein